MIAGINQWLHDPNHPNRAPVAKVVMVAACIAVVALTIFIGLLLVGSGNGGAVLMVFFIPILTATLVVRLWNPNHVAVGLPLLVVPPPVA